MKKTRTEIIVPELPFKLEQGDGVVTLGSCFAQEIGGKMAESGLDVTILPFGIAFHPFPLFQSILDVLEGKVREERFRQTEKGWVSLDYQGKLFADSSEGLVDVIRKRQAEVIAKLDRAKLLVITMGTSWGYFHREAETVVANCHKIRQAEFDKVLATSSAMIATGQWAMRALRERCPDLNAVFTVSPVRHWKDGGIENQRSKARLVETAHTLCERNAGTFYFPSYEIMIDELRDYKYFKDDLLHPNEEAVEYIWGKWVKSFTNGKERSRKS